MKKYRICFEIEGLAEDEIGNPYPGGLCLTLGEDTDPEATPEEYDRKYGEGEDTYGKL